MSPAALPHCVPEDAGLSSARLARIDEVLGAEIARGWLPGAVALVAREGRIAYHTQCGVRDPASGAAMTPDAIFRIYSMTKPIVSVAIMMLAEEGRLLLADPLARFLPGFGEPKVAIEAEDGRGAPSLVPAERLESLHDLLRHASGYVYTHTAAGGLQRLYQAEKVARRDQSNADLAAELARLPLAFQPGARWHYGHSTDLLGRVVEVVTGRRLGEALQAMILGPLGMKDTGFSVPSAQHHRITQPFATDPESGAAVALLAVTEPPLLESGGGGLVSTAADYARFLAMLAGGGTLAGVRILGRKSIEQMSADHIGDIPADRSVLPRGYRFGLGFAVRREAGLAALAGSKDEYYWSGAAGTAFWIDPQEGLFALLMTQAPGQREYLRMLFRNLIYASLDD